MAVLHNVDGLLESWFNKWESFLSKGKTVSPANFHSNQVRPRRWYHWLPLRFAQFCMSTYATRNLKISDPQLAEAQQASVRRSVTAAASFCTGDPVSKDERVRYLADFGFVMVSFCCLFVIRACEAFGSCLPDLLDHLTTVDEAAQLMKEVATDSDQAPSLYSTLISKKLEELRTSTDLPEDGWLEGHSFFLSVCTVRYLHIFLVVTSEVICTFHVLHSTSRFSIYDIPYADVPRAVQPKCQDLICKLLG